MFFKHEIKTEDSLLPPTADMHNHMEAIPVDLVKRLAKKHELDLPENIFTPDGKRYNWSNFQEFLDRYADGTSFIRDLDDITEIAYAFLKRGHEESACIYTELTVSSIHLCKATQRSYSEVIEAVVAGIKRAEAAFDVHARINIVLVRHEGGFTAEGINTEIPVSICNEVVEEVIKNKHPYVRGIVLAGAEQFPPHLFKDAFAKARAAGLKLSAHAGEVTHAQDVLNTIEHLAPDRIGHGIRASDSEHAIQTIKDKGMTLEICPTSNEMLKNTENHHPHLQKLHQQGVQIVLGTDDASHFNDTTIRREYQIAAKILKLTPKQQLDITRRAIMVSFAEEELKEKLHQKLDMFEAEMCATSWLYERREMPF